MCLLVTLARAEPGLPLVVAANRDERYDRPARPMALVATGPRVLAGIDEEAGGTWLAVNEHGLVAGLTNQPAPGGCDPGRRSRGELPLCLARHPSAAVAVAALAAEVDPSEFNPCSMLVGDADQLFSVELAGGGPVQVTRLDPGRHVLENRPFGTPTGKTAAVAARLAEVEALASPDRVDPFVAALAGLLAEHRPAPPLTEAGPTPDPVRSAACVHAPCSGTRSATIVLVSEAGPPRVWFADGPPCTVPFVEVTGDWQGEPDGRPGEH